MSSILSPTYTSPAEKDKKLQEILFPAYFTFVASRLRGPDHHDYQDPILQRTAYSGTLLKGWAFAFGTITLGIIGFCAALLFGIREEDALLIWTLAPMAPGGIVGLFVVEFHRRNIDAFFEHFAKIHALIQHDVYRTENFHLLTSIAQVCLEATTRLRAIQSNSWLNTIIHTYIFRYFFHGLQEAERFLKKLILEINVQIHTQIRKHHSIIKDTEQALAIQIMQTDNPQWKKALQFQQTRLKSIIENFESLKEIIEKDV